jgi:predicted DNA-binding transcriptional regulator YafY
MGQRSRTETIAAIMATLLARRSWAQAELAREVDVGTETLRKVLGELRAAGVPLECERDHPHVYWSLPKNWFPGGVLFKQEFVPELLRQLRRLPRSQARERLLAVVVEQLPAREKAAAVAPVLSREASEHEERQVPIVEDAATRRVPLFMRYYTASRRQQSERYVSVHLVEVGPPARFIATCHRNGDLRWFRVESRGSLEDVTKGEQSARVDDAPDGGDSIYHLDDRPFGQRADGTKARLRARGGADS